MNYLIIILGRLPQGWISSFYLKTIKLQEQKWLKNTIAKCVYKHPKLSTSYFGNTFLQSLIDKLSHENKNIILLSVFNIDLLHYESHTQTRYLLDRMYSRSFSPQITIPTTITPRSSTLTWNIFTNTFNESLISGNLTVSISDHLVQFLIYPELTINNK